MFPVSSLSVAVQGISDYLDGQFGENVLITTHTPQQASEKVKSGDKHYLNLFFYRVMPSGFHAGAGSDEPWFIRVNALLTPFLTEQGAVAADADLRILGHAIRVLHSNPVVPTVLPGNSLDANDFRSEQHLDYRLQAVLQSPSVEELNHIWTTQGGELAYRLSAVYEFALIPIEPLEHAVEASQITTSIIDMQPNIKARDVKGFIKYGDDANAMPLGGIGVNNPPAATNWLPVALFAEGGVLSNTETVANNTLDIDVALAGPPGERVALEVSWVRANNSTDIQPAEVFTIVGPRIDDPAVIKKLTLINAQVGDSATILIRPVDGAGQPLPTSAYANTLSLDVGGA